MNKIIELFLLLWAVNCENSIDVDVWVDPNNPTFSEYSKSSSLNAACPLSSDDQSLRLILRQFMQEIHVNYEIAEYVQRNLLLRISKHSMTILSKYLNENLENTAETRENIRSSLANIFTVLDEREESWEDKFRQFQPYIFILNIFILPAAFFIIIRTIIKPKNFWILTISTIILVSMYSGYNKKYQEAESRRFAQFQLFHNKNSEACAPETLIQRMFEIFSSPFQYRQKSDCLKYIESQTISIFHEISIIEVFSETISSGFFAFFSSTGKHINHFFKDLYDGAPLIAQIVMTVFLLLMVGTIRTPFFTYEPLLLKFGSSSFGKIVEWFEEKEEPQINKMAKLENEKIEVLKSESEDEKFIEMKENKTEELKEIAYNSVEDDNNLDESENEWVEAKSELIV